MSTALLDKIASQMVEVEGGIFQMGATREQGNEACDDEKPVHSVKVDTFRISKYTVTQGEWMVLMGHNPSHFRGDSSLPVENVSWEDAEFFIAHLNSMTSGGYRLPTEAEWEYAARGGRLTRGFRYSGSNNPGEVAWTSRNSEGRTHPVGKLKPNELGLYDMSGNVCEWCMDWHGEYGSSPLINPRGPSSGESRVLRGGVWYFSPGSARVSYRSGGPPDSRDKGDGFRLAFQG